MHPGPGSAKQVTRRRVRLARAARGVAEADRCGTALAARAEELVALVAGAGGSGGQPPRLTVAAYVSVAAEPGTRALRARLALLGHRVLLPWLQDDLDLDWVVDDLRGTADPADPMHPGGPRLGPGAVAGADLVLVPALAVDGTGTRLGQGGGSYDRALARLPGDRPPVLAVVHDEELLPAGRLPRERHDVGVDGVLTPSALRLLGDPLSRPAAAPDARGPGRPPPRA